MQTLPLQWLSTIKRNIIIKIVASQSASFHLATLMKAASITQELQPLENSRFYMLQERVRVSVTYFLISEKIFAWIAASVPPPAESVLFCSQSSKFANSTTLRGLRWPTTSLTRPRSLPSPVAPFKLEANCKLFSRVPAAVVESSWEDIIDSLIGDRMSRSCLDSLGVSISKLSIASSTSSGSSTDIMRTVAIINSSSCSSSRLLVSPMGKSKLDCICIPSRSRAQIRESSSSVVDCSDIEVTKFRRRKFGVRFLSAITESFWSLDDDGGSLDSWALTAI